VFSGSPTTDNLNPMDALYVKIRHESCEQACSQCPPKCEVQVSATIYYFYFDSGANNFGFVAYNPFSVGGFGDQCGNCTASPICSPSGKSGAFGFYTTNQATAVRTLGTVTIQ
jgi:hypothetical protein